MENFFNEEFYLAANPDVAAAVANGDFDSALQHYLFHGRVEGRAASPAALDSFNEEAYLALNPDVAAAVEAGAFLTGMQHYLMFGIREARQISYVDEINTFTLTSGTDRLNGTAGNDFFDAPIAQNPWAGGISNTLSTADRLDGGAGWDILHAELVPEFYGVTGDNEVEVQPRTQNIQEIRFEAMDVTSAFNDGAIVVDAKNMLDVVKIGSWYSDGDLVIENLTTKTSTGAVRNTDSITITMDHTDNFNSDEDASDLHVYFDDNYLLSGQESEFTLELRIVNAFQLAEANDPLVGFLAVTFTAGTEEVTVDISTADTYAEVVTLINAELVSRGIDATAVALPLRNAVFTDDIGPYLQGELAGQYTPVQLVSNSVALTAGPILLDSNVEDFDGLNTWTNPTSSTSDNPVAVNVELHKVGRGDMGGDLIIGAKGGHQGIPVIYVDVLGDASKPSNLGQIDTTAGALDQIFISTHADYVGGDSFASLTIREDFDSTPTLVNANSFLGNLTLGGPDGEFYSRFENIRTMTATGGGNVTYWAEVGTSALASLGNLNFTATTAGGNDTINVNVGGGAQMTVTTGGGNDRITASVTGETDSTSTQSSITVNAASGNNTVVLTSTDAEVNEAFVTTGGGTDVVRGGATFLTASTGAGNDTIYAENTGDFTEAAIAAGVLTTTLGVDATITNVNVNNVELLNGRQVQITLAMPGLDGETNANLAVPFVNGFEFVANIQAATGSLTTELDVYRAVRDAINSHAVVSKLAVASIDSNGNLTIDYLVDGESVALDAIIDLEILGDWSDLTSSQQSSIVSALKVKYSDSTIASADVQAAYNALEGDTQAIVVTEVGTASDMGSANVINAGLGNDVIVLSSEAADQVTGRFDTVEFSAGAFGNNTIVHFQADDDGDVLDFTAWLNNVESASGSTTSQVRIDTTVEFTAAAFIANSVRVVDFNAISTTVAIDEWSDLAGASASALLAWVDGTFDSVDESGTDLVGTTQNSILIVQNFDGTDGNQGEYAVFQVVSATSSDAINSVQLIGTLDFSYEQAFTADNFA